MSLIFSKNNQPDNRMIEYDQAVIRLGLEKAKAQTELDHCRDEVKEIGTRKAALLDEILLAESQLAGIKKEINDAIQKGKDTVTDFSQHSQNIDKKNRDKKEKLAALELYLDSLQEKIKTKEETFDLIASRINELRKIFSESKRELSFTLAEKAATEADIIALQELKSELKNSIESAENMLKYLSEKEQFLNRKEADLIKYEERVEKMRQEIGDNNKMIFK